MKFSLFCLMSLLLVDVCSTGRTWQDILARMRKRRSTAPAGYLDIYVRSEGCNDPGKTPNTCGIAYIKVNGRDHSLHRRGHNVVVVDATTGVVLASVAFDTHGDGNAGNRLKDYLNAIHGDKIVLVAVQDEGSRFGSVAFDALKRLGGYDPIAMNFRGSYALVGYARVIKPSWVTQQLANSHHGPSEISVKVPLTPYPYVDIDIRSEGCEDPGKTPNTCGIAYIKVDGIERSPRQRGHNVVIVDAETGSVLDAKRYDTHLDGNSGIAFGDYLDKQRGNKIILVAVQDEGANHVGPAVNALRRVGAVDPVMIEYRGSFAFIGYADASTNRPIWITQQVRGRGQGPSVVSSRIPLSPSRPPSVDVYIRSEGCNDPQKTPNTCGIAYIRVNGKDRSGHRRGHNAVVLDLATGSLVDSQSFDTHLDDSAGDSFRDFLDRFGAGNVVLVAIQDEGSRRMSSAVDALKRLGAVDPVIDYRGSYALVGNSRTVRPPWITEQKRQSGQGPSEININIPLSSNCLGALGLENGAIPDGQLGASTEWDANLNIPQGRLRSPRSWSARVNDANQWYQVDLGSEHTKVTGTATQGRGDHPQWVTKYKLQSSKDGANFNYYREKGAVKEFLANADQHTVVFHALIPPVMARYIRFKIVTWHGHISMRAEVYGCPGCRQALGMENYIIADGQISASSQWDDNYAAIQGRLHFKQPGKSGAWSAKTNDVNQWLQIDLRDMYTKVSRVASQGRDDADQWVTKYKLQYSTDGVNFQYYKDEGQAADKEFLGNADRTTVVYHALYPAVSARYIRFRPLAWHNHVSVRVEVFGCQDANECAPAPCQNGGTCVDLVGNYRCDCKEGYSGNNCETNVNDCSPDPCQNGATCVDLVGSYRCDCKEGYSGNNCETNIDDCAPAPCQNGGTCVDGVGSYQCVCTAGYSGTNCETDIDDCAPAPCQNGGTCVDGVGSYQCVCTAGYSGTNCETDINECAPSPCKNGGTCVDRIGYYHCDCAAGWFGTTCEEAEIDECEE